MFVNNFIIHVAPCKEFRKLASPKNEVMSLLPPIAQYTAKSINSCNIFYTLKSNILDTNNRELNPIHAMYCKKLSIDR